MDANYLRDIVNYILEEHNITETANYFGKSRKTIYNYLKMISDEKSEFYNKSLGERIALTLEKLKLEARKKAGEKSRREQVLSDEVALQIIEQILSKQLPLRTLAKMYNCSHTSIANAIRRVADKETLREINIIYNNPDVGDKSWIK